MSQQTDLVPDSTASQSPLGAKPRGAKLILPESFTRLPAPPDAPFVRQQGYDDGHVWIGEVTTEPGTASPWHHHGDYITFAYLLEGEARLEYLEPDLEPLEVATDGALVVIPKGMVHREINPGSQRNRFLIVRVGSGPAVIPVDVPPAS